MKSILDSKTGFLNYKNVFEDGVQIYMILGQRSDGKTYGALNDSIQGYCKTGIPSAYIRRFAESLTKSMLQDLCRPHAGTIKKLTKGKYCASEYKSKRFFLSNISDDAPEQDKNSFLNVYALNTWENAKGADSGEFYNIIFDEFVSNNKYLPNEYAIFENVLSSIMRKRTGSRLIMLGNPINQICPYFDEFNIEPHKLTPGDIIYRKSSNGTVLKFIYVPPMSTKHNTLHSIFDFNNKGSIQTGYWEYGNFPRLPHNILNSSEFVFSFGIMYKNQFAMCDFYQHSDFIFCAWRPGNPDKMLSDAELTLFSDMHMFHENVYTAFSNPKIRELYDMCIRSNRQYFSDNKTGNLVKNWYGDFVKNGGRFV